MVGKIVIVATLLSVAGLALPIELTLLPGGAFDLTYSLDTGQTASAKVELSGVIEAEISPLDRAPERFRFKRSTISLSDADLRVENVGVGSVLIETRGIVGNLLSNARAGAFEAPNVLKNDGHQFRYDQGTITTRYVLTPWPGSNVTVGTDVRDLSAQPDTTSLVGTTTIRTVLLSDSGLVSRYRIDLEHRRDETRSQPVTPLTGATTLFIREVGSFAAQGQVDVISTNFQNWVEQTRGIIPETVADVDPLTKQPLAILYAMRADAGAWSLPVSFPSAATVRLTLPPEGTRAKLRCEFSSDLQGTSWISLTSPSFPDGVLPPGTNGMVIFPIPEAATGFVRLVTDGTP